MRKLYWDTSVFLSLINSKSEKARHDVCQHIVRQAKAGKAVICTSTFSIVEVIRPKISPFPVPLTPEQIHALEGMFQWPFIKKYQVDEVMALKSARLSRETGLKPADSIHAATAIASGSDVLQKWDRDFGKVVHLIHVAEPDYMDDVPLLEATASGPSSPSTEPERPSEQSPSAEPATASGPSPDRPSSRPDDPAQQPPGSSGAAPPPAPSDE